MAAARAAGSTQARKAAIPRSTAPFAESPLIARAGHPSDDDDRAAAADLEQITHLTESGDACAAALDGERFPSSGSSAEYPIHPGKQATGSLDGHRAGDDGLLAAPSLSIADQRARAMRVRVGPGKGAI